MDKGKCHIKIRNTQYDLALLKDSHERLIIQHIFLLRIPVYVERKGKIPASHLGIIEL